MKIHVFSDEIELENHPISLGDAFQLLENQSSQERVQDNFIGFTFDNDEQLIIQFVRVTDQEWLLDIPTYENREYQGTLVTSILHQQVFSITRDFFNRDSALHLALSEKEYTKLTNLIKNRYSLILEFDNS